MTTVKCIDANFAYRLISELKIMTKEDGRPFITHGVTLPFLVYAYKHLYKDESPITIEDIDQVVSALDHSKQKFVYQYCSDINEYVIALFSITDIPTYKAEEYYPRSNNTTMLYDPQRYKIAPSAKMLYNQYKKEFNEEKYSKVYKEYKYDWAVLSSEELAIIDTVISKCAQC